MKLSGKYFYGHEISQYGQEHGFLDYGTLASAFDCVLNNDIMNTTADIGCWEPWSGSEEYYEDTHGARYTWEEADDRKEELQKMINELEDRITIDNSEEEDAATQAEIDKLQADIDALEDAYYVDVYQTYIVSENGAEILKDAGEIVYYNDALDMFVWCVTHYGTAWSYVLTNVRCNTGYDEDEE